MKLICSQYIKDIMPQRSAYANKYSVGSVLCVAGSYSMAGAAILCAKAALRMGAGYVKCVVTPEIYPIVSSAVPEAVFKVLPAGKDGAVSCEYAKEIVKAANKSSAVLIGCGSKLCKDTESIVQSLIYEGKVPILIDADGINVLCRHIDILKEGDFPIVITPHEGEMCRLTGKPVDFIRLNREAVAQDFSDKYDVVTVLKGKDTLVTYNGEECVQNPTGNSGMAVAGMGDVLSGVIVSLMAQGLNAFDAAKAGVYLHGLAADLAAEELTEYSLLPSDVIDYIPKAIKEVM